MSENWQQSEICIVINDISQDSTAKHLSYDGFLHYTFVNHCAGKRIFKIREHLAKLQAKWLSASYAPFALRLLSSKMENSLDKLNKLFLLATDPLSTTATTKKNCHSKMLYMISSQSVTDDGISLSVRKSKLAYNSLIFVDISYHITLICLLT